MNRIQAKRLLNVAKALRESKSPQDFTMGSYTNDTDICWTPACALGHYAARPDLQRLLVIKKRNEGTPFECSDIEFCGGGHADFAAYDNEEVMAHFGITADEAESLFGGYGCDNAQTPKAAARYIERFVARKAREAGRGRR